MGSQFWGTGMFAEGARLVLDFAFDVVGANRLEARAAVANGRGNGALRKLGAVQEGMLRRSFQRNGAVSRSGAVGILCGRLAHAAHVQQLANDPLAVDPAHRLHAAKPVSLRASKLRPVGNT